MKLNKLSLACAAALAFPVAAHAVAPANYYDTAGAKVIYMSGASAPDNFLAGIAAGMFKPGYFSYIDTGSSALPGKAYTAFLGETAAAYGTMPANTKVLLIKRSKGGSVFGVDPVARAQAIQTLKIDSTCTLASGTLYKCATQGLDPSQAGYIAANSMVPDVGTSDVPPSMFKAPYNVEFGQPQLDSDAGLDKLPVQTVMMGMVATSAVPDDAFLSRATYGAMLSGMVTNWSMVNRTGAAGATVAPAAGNQVVVCRRWPGSGTQSSYNWYFNNFPCTTNSLTSGVSGETVPARMTDSAGYGMGGLGLADGSNAANAIGVDVTAGYTVIENSGSGDVRACLKAAQNGGVYTFLSEDNKYHRVDFGTTGGYGAIGVLSLDSQEKTADGAESAWYFRAVDGSGVFHYTTQSCSSSGTLSGVCPSHQNLLQGQIDFAGEVTMQYRNGTDGKPVVDATKKPFIDEFAKRAGDPTYAKNWTAALPLASNGYTPTFVLDASNNSTGVVNNHVARATRNGNMCAPLQQAY